MQRHFDDELRQLHEDLLKMGALAEEAIADSISALQEQNKVLANKVISSDTIVDELENTINERCLTLLALRQPMATDLRYITTAMSINNELERIADLAVDIAQQAIKLSGKPLLKPLVDIPKLCSMSRRMVKDAIDSYVKRDTELARRVIKLEPEADSVRNYIRDELIYEYISKDPSAAPKAIPLLLIAQCLERICDHATNIAEDVVYIVAARMVKHHLDLLSSDENGEKQP